MFTVTSCSWSWSRNFIKSRTGVKSVCKGQWTVAVGSEQWQWAVDNGQWTEAEDNGHVWNYRSPELDHSEFFGPIPDWENGRRDAHAWMPMPALVSLMLMPSLAYELVRPTPKKNFPQCTVSRCFFIKELDLSEGCRQTYKNCGILKRKVWSRVFRKQVVPQVSGRVDQSNSLERRYRDRISHPTGGRIRF